MIAKSDRSFDTIVLGGGTAGCVIASRLSEQPGHTVALVEAGPDYGPVASGHWPGELVSSIFAPGSHDWGYSARAPQGDLRLFRGRVVGGSSAVNAVGIAWGTRRDYDRWAELSYPEWGFEGLLPYLQKVERCEDPKGWFHGRDGQVAVTRHKLNSPYVKDLRRAFEAAGVAWLSDLNEPDAREGVGRSFHNAVGRQRVHAAAAYLDPARERSNLTILDESPIDRIDWKGRKATRVRVLRGGQEVWLEAGRIVLTAGAIGSVGILERSGIGPAERLRAILEPGASLHDLPGVGENLWDHPGVSLEYEASAGSYERLARAFGGPELVAEVQIIARLKSDPALEWFDLDVIPWHGIRPPRSPDHNRLRFPTFLLRPARPGRVTITSGDPSAAPRIETGFGDATDIAALARAVERMRTIASQPAIHRWFGPERSPGAEHQGDGLHHWVGQNLRTYNHCCGSARLGPASDPGAVVDAGGRVHGFENLYVADASIMPTIPRAATSLTVFAIAEKVAAGLRGST